MFQRNSKSRRRVSFGLAALVVVAVSSAGCQRDATASAAPPRAEMRTVTVPVSGMIMRFASLARLRRPLQIVSGCALLAVAVYFVRASATFL